MHVLCLVCDCELKTQSRLSSVRSKIVLLGPPTLCAKPNRFVPPFRATVFVFDSEILSTINLCTRGAHRNKYFGRVIASGEYSDSDVQEELDMFIEDGEMFSFGSAGANSNRDASDGKERKGGEK